MIKKFVFIGFLIGFGFAMAIFPFVPYNKKGGGIYKSSESNQYPLLARRIFTDNPSDLIINFTQLRNDIKKYIGEQDLRIGFYFEYLPTGLSISANDQDAFYRASLVKLPIIMKAYKLIEEGKIDKDEMLPITRDDIDEGYGDLWRQGRTEISFSEAVNLTLSRSDNTAFRVINRRVDKEIKLSGNEVEKALTEVYQYLDLPLSENGATESITPKGYVSILKSLFFSAYLSYDNSSEILNYLSKSAFTDWMSEPVPDDIQVAHKTGTFDIEKSIYSVQSDCGIVYYPDRPYLLCVMINSDNLEESLTHIRHLSKMVFDYVKEVNGK